MYRASEELLLWLEAMFCWSYLEDRTMGELVEFWHLPWDELIGVLVHIEKWYDDGRPIYYVSDVPLRAMACWEAGGRWRQWAPQHDHTMGYYGGSLVAGEPDPDNYLDHVHGFPDVAAHHIHAGGEDFPSNPEVLHRAQKAFNEHPLSEITQGLLEIRRTHGAPPESYKPRHIFIKPTRG